MIHFAHRYRFALQLCFGLAVLAAFDFWLASKFIEQIDAHADAICEAERDNSPASVKRSAEAGEGAPWRYEFWGVPICGTYFARPRW